MEKHSLNFQGNLHIEAAGVVSQYPSMGRNLIRISITAALKQFSQWPYKCIDILVQTVMFCLNNVTIQYFI